MCGMRLASTDCDEVQTLTEQELIERVVADKAGAWDDFLKRYSRLVFRIAWGHARKDQDLCCDLYLFVIDGLRQTSESKETWFRLRAYLRSMDQYGDQARFPTWLARVAGNLIRDHHRKLIGRHTLPRTIQRLELQDQEIYKLLYWENLSERDAFGVLQSSGSTMGQEEFDVRIERLYRNLRSCNRWAICRNVARRSAVLPIEGDPSETAHCLQVADPSPAAAPDRMLLIREQEHKSRRMRGAIRGAVLDMEPTQQKILLLRYGYGMTARQIAKVIRRKNEKSIYADLDRVLHGLQRELRRQGFAWNQVEEGLSPLEGLLVELEHRAGALLPARRPRAMATA